ncbi:polyprenyl synthetase family protein [Phaeocystidibacter luteus]|uniref:Polyprenyl synthetase family protein n=1 Tax=Phaeocystidibacter luteus TaxID=911197 RepID=A0A6N6RKH3_9FLAO|nr:polyprenyl synthetase family protein [Phaeocystidibacter luteus]KAB2807017.1 polyprenyl synthetase family protein [Phaeocystidibacter luteus]
MRDLKSLQELFIEAIEGRNFGENPANLYEPFHYILSLGGKRLRPVLTLLACEAFGAKAEKALEPAIGIELFHNFSLIHDDIMDDAPLRRGRQTVHERWDSNIGILSGDAMLVKAYQSIGQVEDNILREVNDVFSKAALEICEGQQWDMDFETRMDVTEDEYIRMIQYKTSVLLGAALQIGARVGGADDVGAVQAYNFGLNLGTAFQIKDDLLDAFGDPLKFGKQVGGDIRSNKKTILLIHALQHAKGEERDELQMWLDEETRIDQKVEAVKKLFNEIGSVRYAEQRMEAYYRMALNALEECEAHGANISEMKAFAEYLYTRDH